MPAISIIVPVYNVEKHLPRCIDSILAQTFKDFELILINDGSTDDSGRICDEYANISPKIIVIHNGNHGVSSARNSGLDVAQGEYVTFIDSDDYIKPCFLENLYNNKCDITVSGIEWVDSSDHFLTQNKFFNVRYSNRSEIDFFEIYNGIMMHSPVAKLFNNKIIQQNRLRFNLNISWGEDSVFVVDFMRHTNSITILDAVDYIYVRYNNSNTLSTKLRHDLLDNIVFSREYCANFVAELCPSRSDQISKLYKHMIDWLCIGFLQSTIANEKLSKTEKLSLLNRYTQNSYVVNILNNPFEYLHHTDPFALAFNEKVPEAILSKYTKIITKNKIISYIHKNIFLKLPFPFQKTIKRFVKKFNSSQG